MVMKQYKIMICDECKKEIKETESISLQHIKLHITEWRGTSGDVVINKDFCSDKCILNFISKLKKIPKVKHYF